MAKQKKVPPEIEALFANPQTERLTPERKQRLARLLDDGYSKGYSTITTVAQQEAEAKAAQKIIDETYSEISESNPQSPNGDDIRLAGDFNRRKEIVKKDSES